MGARKLTAAQQAEIDQRRTMVAANLLSGLSLRDIAQLSSWSLGTIASDAKYLRKQWQKEALDDISQMIAVECKRLDALMNAIWQKAVGSNIQGQTPILPDMDAIEAVRRLIGERAKLLGLVAPKQLDLTSGGQPVKPAASVMLDLSGLSDEQLDRLADTLKD